MSYIISGTDSAGAVCLKRDSAAAAIKKALELMGDGCGEFASRTQMAAFTVMRNSTNFVQLRGRSTLSANGPRLHCDYTSSPSAL
jgi:hypothetical protein